MFAGSRRLRRIRRNDLCRRISSVLDTFRRLLLQIGGANIAGADRALRAAIGPRQPLFLRTEPQMQLEAALERLIRGWVRNNARCCQSEWPADKLDRG
jgi:hypothetical protein